MLRAEYHNNDAMPGQCKATSHIGESRRCGQTSPCSALEYPVMSSPLTWEKEQAW